MYNTKLIDNSAVYGVFLSTFLVIKKNLFYSTISLPDFSSLLCLTA